MENIDSLINDIKIPEGIDLAVKKGIERGRREKQKKGSSRNKYKNIAVAATAAVFITTAAGVMNPEIVKAIPGMESIFKLVKHGNMGEQLEQFEQFSTSVNKTAENNGIKVTIDEIVIDDNTLAITSIVEGENLSENRVDMGFISLNGESVASYSEKDKKIGDNKLIIITYANVSNMELSEEVDVKINIPWVDEVKGPWEFKFKVSKADDSTKSKDLNLDKTIKLPSSTLKLEKLVISPLGNTINYTGVFDNLNKSEFHNTGIYNFVVMDDKGRILQTTQGSGHSNEERYEGSINIINNLSNVKSLTVVPVLKKSEDKTKEIEGIKYQILQTTVSSTDLNIPQEVVTKSRAATEKEKSEGYGWAKVTHVYNIDKAREFETLGNLVNKVIKVGENSTALIKGIEATDKETKITFKLEGSSAYPFGKINFVEILDEDFNDIGTEFDGPMAVLEDVEERIASVKLPPLDQSKKYKIALPIMEEPEIDDKYKIDIDLNN
ncbi:hypothetical protein J2Z44_002751 [Clostridium punense]|uniref:DUF4179 domain-containing protein n=1 Tax=Clostridium punense TaxID=1054297 RepID=A0ABS4K6S4_9CLOT|nr:MULTISPECIES: DUF4179 domain-containing protein [Clostridium]EQB85866.1 hypothetical protein M918_17110 [Clostridium sp. BL8]MBP2022926.1 hypothetical protein [Clostridium punense]